MKKKSILWGLLAMFVVATLSVGFTACGDDDDFIVGTWSGRDGRHQLILTFNSDGSGSYINRYEDPYSGTETEAGSFTYTMEGSSKGIIIYKYNDSYYGNGTNIAYFVIADNTLLLFEHNYYDELEWELTKQ